MRNIKVIFNKSQKERNINKLAKYNNRQDLKSH